jgi:ABC-2 type transport system ATP-binding protein
MSILVDNLSKTYGSQNAIDGISFQTSPGSVVGFLGPNGAGKSTTMKILTGYIPQTSGSAEVCGFNLETQSLAARHCIGYLPELNPLYTDMYIKEYLLFTAGMMGMKGKSADDAVESMIAKTGITPERKKKIGQLSKGYKQRVGLAAALLHNPKVLILDEPTSGLDPNQVVEIRNLIKEIAKDKTVIFSTHIMQEVEALCSRVIIINKGKLVADNDIAGLQQMMRKHYVVKAEIKGLVDKSRLEKLKGVNAIAQHGALWQITSTEDIRESLAMLAQEQQWIILSLQLEEQSLEDVFQTLTK